MREQFFCIQAAGRHQWKALKIPRSDPTSVFLKVGSRWQGQAGGRGEEWWGENGDNCT